jgi:hypothetical protein
MTGEGVLPLWTVYDHPRDYPEVYVARMSVVLSGGTCRITDEVILSGNLQLVRNALHAKGLVPIERDPRDDPKIIEVWI